MSQQQPPKSLQIPEPIMAWLREAYEKLREHFPYLSLGRFFLIMMLGPPVFGAFGTGIAWIQLEELGGIERPENIIASTNILMGVTYFFDLFILSFALAVVGGIYMPVYLAMKQTNRWISAIFSKGSESTRRKSWIRCFFEMRSNNIIRISWYLWCVSIFGIVVALEPSRGTTLVPFNDVLINFGNMSPIGNEGVYMLVTIGIFVLFGIGIIWFPKLARITQGSEFTSYTVITIALWCILVTTHLEIYSLHQMYKAPVSLMDKSDTVVSDNSSTWLIYSSADRIYLYDATSSSKLISLPKKDAEINVRCRHKPMFEVVSMDVASC